MLRFLHTADWQIGKAFQSTEDNAKREALRKQRLDTVRGLKSLIDEQKLQFVDVCGDLFDSATPDQATVSALCSAVGSLEVPVYAIPGNHDHAGPGCIWEKPFFQREIEQLAPNLHPLLKPEPIPLEQAVLLPCPMRRRHENTSVGTKPPTNASNNPSSTTTPSPPAKAAAAASVSRNEVETKPSFSPRRSSYHDSPPSRTPTHTQNNALHETMNHHIITTGISLITNWMNAQTPRANLQDAIRHHNAVRDQFLADPLLASAEINSLNARTDFVKNPTSSDLGVTLVYTTTEEGKLVHSAIAKFLKSRKFGRVDSMPVKGLNKPAGDATPDWAQQNVTEALEGLRDGLEQHISKLRAVSPAPHIEINCTGGYKAETAILYSLAKELDIPVYYLHESFKTCVVLP